MLFLPYFLFNPTNSSKKGRTTRVSCGELGTSQSEATASQSDLDVIDESLSIDHEISESSTELVKCNCELT